MPVFGHKICICVIDSIDRYNIVNLLKNKPITIPFIFKRHKNVLL